MRSVGPGVRDNAPIFVVGCSRSGTTLLRLMLTCHPDVCIPPESPFITKLYPKWARTRVQTMGEVERLCGELFSCDNKFSDWGLTFHQILDELKTILPFDYRQFVEGIFRLYVRQTKKRAIRWGDKNPRHVNHIQQLMDLFPKAKFVHIIRDGRAVLNSFINANRKQRRMYPDTPCEAAQYWADVLRVSSPFQNHPCYFEIHYEDLVASPEKELRQLCDFLELRYLPDEMLSYPLVNASLELVPKHRLAWHQATIQALDISKISHWQRELKWHYTILFELCAGWELSKYGYTLTLPFTQSRSLNHAARQVEKILRCNSV